MWTQELGQKCLRRGRQKDRYQTKEEGETEHTGRGNQVQGTAKRAEKEVKQN